MPACRELLAVEQLRRLERLRRTFRRAPPEGRTEHPLPRESDQVEPVVRQVWCAPRVQVQVDRSLLDERGVARRARSFLDSVGDKRSKELELAHACAHPEP